MTTKEKLSWIVWGVCFLFCVLLSRQGWSAAYVPEEKEDGFSLLRRTSLEPALPAIDVGHEDIYTRFMNGRLIYKPNPSNDIGKVETPFATTVNPATLEGTFDLSRFGDAGKYLSISAGYRKGKKAENSNKVETWIVPKFVVEWDIDTTTRHLAPIMDSFTSPLGHIWTPH